MNKKETTLSKLSDVEFSALLTGINSVIFTLDKVSRNYVIATLGEERANKIMYRSKVGNNEGQYGYYFNAYGLFSLIRACRNYKIESLIEIGSGLGIIGQILKQLNIEYKGIEIEEDLVKCTCDRNPILGDIFNQTALFYKGATAIYMWECFYSDELNKKFYYHIKENLPLGYMIFYISAGSLLGKLLKNDKEFKVLPSQDSILVFKRIRKKRIHGKN